MAHELEADLPGGLVPGDVELRVLLLQLAQLAQCGVNVGPLRKAHLIGQHRLQQRDGGLRLHPQALAGIGMTQARNSAHLPRRDGLRQTVLGAGVQAQLVSLLLPEQPGRLPAAGPAVGEEGLHPEAAPCDLQIGEPSPLGVPGDLKDLCTELLGVQGRDGIPPDALEQFRHAVQLQRRTEPAGKHLPVANE